MITNFWNTVDIVCGCHNEHIPMNIQQGPHSLFYSCPKYYPQNREAGERACANRINLVDYEDMLKTLSNAISEGELNNEIVNLERHRWSKKSIDFEVLSHSKDKITVSVKNKKALK